MIVLDVAGFSITKFGCSSYLMEVLVLFYVVLGDGVQALSIIK